VADFYKKPYLDSGVFIAWIKGERIKRRDASGQEEIVDRGKIGEHILTLAEKQLFPVIISALTIAEVHKKRNMPKLADDENQNVLDYFEHEFVRLIQVDRSIGEEANKLCRRYEEEKLSPNDAIHLACAKRAGCDVLLSWDDTLNAIEDPDIITQEPRILEEPRPPASQILLFHEETEGETAKQETVPNAGAPDVRGSGNGHPEGEAGAKTAQRRPEEKRAAKE
jgi:predicted nucleic acid-binding protein